MGLLGAICLGLLVVPPPLGASVAEPGSAASAAGFGGGVASQDDEATRAAHDILASGGTSTDAAVGAAAVLAVRQPRVAGLGGGSVVVHVDASGAAAVDGCAPLSAPDAWRAAEAAWGAKEEDLDVYGAAEHLAAAPLRRALASATAHLSRTSSAVAPQSLPTERLGDLDVAGGAVGARAAHVAGDAYATVVVADRWGSLTAVVSSMGRVGGSGAVDRTTGVARGADLPALCGDALPTVLLAPGAGGQLDPLLAVAPGSARRPATADSRAAVRDVLQARTSDGSGLRDAVRAQAAPLVAVEYVRDGRVEAVGDPRGGGSAAVVHAE
ncbi:gamma-glutamyltranspeptidase [Motilibacter rhizosphaerae]|uniref:Gamma-glutamyltranspeptidase n=1 Tax=Motilibacter rhizosphaerae TaxID=598652 RepID=A0A4Q7NNV2_9ACTN|nr:gamma-glutamyltransferase [Motilibacter rhizosphaerae]RZS86915.1 gamma-glutamyltranspeptidase [Motilibacter rhizosphaerae]